MKLKVKKGAILLDDTRKNNTSFFILLISKHSTNIYKCTNDKIETIKNNDFPIDFHDVTNSKVQEKCLQFHTSNADGALKYHGHKDKKANHEEVLMISYIKNIDSSISRYLKDKDKPLIVAGTEKLVAAFKGICKYNYLVEESFYGNYENCNDTIIYKKGWEILFPMNNKF